MYALHVEWLERRVLAEVSAGLDSSLTAALAAFDAELAAPVRTINPELAEQRRAMGIAV